ncbi:MAG: AMP-binding protein [Proteobacteria bacterium]|nr:AMP-binding protein [Pseudomonadota bacterium]
MILPNHIHNMVDLLHFRAQQHQEEPLYIFLGDGECETQHMSFADLHQYATNVATWLVDRAEPGSRALLSYPPGLDFVGALFGCLYAGVLAVPAHPPEPRRLARTLPRLRTIANDAQISCVLTHSSIAGFGESLALNNAPWLATDTVPRAVGSPVFPAIKADSLAYLQYTSGSTAAPKGVMVSHRNLLHQLADFDIGYDHDDNSVMVTWLPAFHDLGLVYGYLMPLFMGFKGVSFSPFHFVQRPIRWVEAIDRYRGTHSPAPNFAFDMVAQNVPAKANYDLSCWQVALNGAEPIFAESERRFVEALSPHGLHPNTISHAFGMSETTAKVTSEPRGTPCIFTTVNDRQVAGCGVATGDTQVAIVDPESRSPMPDEEEGEVWVSGTTVAQGYWNNTKATRSTFEAQLSTGPQTQFLRTGDLGFIKDKNLFISGRLKDLIIIRGQNHYPQDLEWAIQSQHPAIRPASAAAFSINSPDEQLVIATEVYPDRIDSHEAVFAAIRRTLADHGLQASAISLLAPRAIAKTSSGKIQRQKTRQAFQQGTLETIALWQAAGLTSTGNDGLRQRLERAPNRRRVPLVQQHLQKQAALLLGVDPSDIDTDSPMHDLGLDSVRAVQLVEDLATQLSLSFSSSVAFDHPTIDALATFVVEQLHPREAPEEEVGNADINSMSDDEVEAMLLRELEKL